MEHELEIAVAAARRAGAAIMDVYNRENLAVTHKEGDKGPLTEADLASDRILLETIGSAFPDDAILSEETKDDPQRVHNRRCWIVDPLDGTREFTLGLPEFVVSIGLSVDGEAVLGVLYNPVLNEMIVGAKGYGVTVNGAKAAVTSHGKIAGARFLVSRNEMEKGWFDGYEGVELQPLGSVAYKLGLVAIGRAEATFTPKPRNEWDLCGGVAVLLAAGGRATDGSGAPYRFNQLDPLKIGVCGTNGAVHDQVMGLMQGR